jgi:hypothetical protein
MIGSRDELDDVVLRVEAAFLDDPMLALTREQVCNLFCLDAWTCASVLGALVEAGILTNSCEGFYVSWFPRLAGMPLGRVRLPEPRPAGDELDSFAASGRPA